MDAPPLEESVKSAALLDQPKTTEQTISTSFRFVDLPAEIRNKIYRYMPIFYSNNAFVIKGSRKEHVWLRRMRPEGRNELRKLTYQVSAVRYKHDYSVYNALSLCSRVHLTLKVRPRHLVTASRDGSLMNMHGFAAVTSDVLPTELDICQRHQWGVSSNERQEQQVRMKCVQALLQQFQKPCVGKCRVHRGREGTHTQATIHLSFEQTCFFCC